MIRTRSRGYMTTPQRYVSPNLTHFAGRTRADDEQRYLLLKHILGSGEIRNPHESKSPGLMRTGNGARSIPPRRNKVAGTVFLCDGVER